MYNNARIVQGISEYRRHIRNDVGYLRKIFNFFNPSSGARFVGMMVQA